MNDYHMSRLDYSITGSGFKHRDELIWRHRKGERNPSASLFFLTQFFQLPNYLRISRKKEQEKKKKKKGGLSLLSIRLDCCRRDPWSTMITPSSSPTPCSAFLNDSRLTVNFFREAALLAAICCGFTNFIVCFLIEQHLFRKKNANN